VLLAWLLISLSPRLYAEGKSLIPNSKMAGLRNGIRVCNSNTMDVFWFLVFDMYNLVEGYPLFCLTAGQRDLHYVSFNIRTRLVRSCLPSFCFFSHRQILVVLRACAITTSFVTKHPVFAAQRPGFQPCGHTAYHISCENSSFHRTNNLESIPAQLRSSHFLWRAAFWRNRCHLLVFLGSLTGLRL